MPTEPDYRFTLANERTFLAWMRTALGLIAAGVAVDQFVSNLGPAWMTTAVALAALLLGGAVAVVGLIQWSRVQRAMRLGRALPPPRAVPVVAAVLAALAVLLAVALLVG